MIKVAMCVIITIFISSYFTEKKGSFSLLGVVIATILGVLILKL